MRQETDSRKAGRADKAKALPENRESRFAELKLSFGTPAFAPSAQRIPTQVIDEKRQRLQKMRAMASAELSLLGNTAKTFYYQAKFMEVLPTTMNRPFRFLFIIPAIR